jgi:hypothetical protein
MDHKECSKCKQIKRVDEFSKSKRIKSGYRSSCKKCEIEQQRKLYQTNEESRKKARERYKRWAENNPDKLKTSLTKSDRLRSKTEHRRKYKKEYQRKRRQSLEFRLRCNISRQIVFMLKAKSGSKRGQSILEVLSYSIDDLRGHLESQFDENMSWENYGSYWHIDHIYPHSLLPYSSMDDENFKKCWALENLRPLEAKANLMKGNKVASED